MQSALGVSPFPYGFLLHHYHLYDGEYCIELPAQQPSALGLLTTLLELKTC